MKSLNNNKKTTTLTNFKDFIFSVYNVETLKMILSFALSAFAAVLIITTLYSVFRQSKDKEIIISTIIMTDDGRLTKGWEMTPDLENAVATGDISLKGITAVEEGGEITFDGGDSDKITIVNYETVIEDNKNPQIYSDEYFEELKRQGKNTYVVKTLGLATEATEKEGAE